MPYVGQKPADIISTAVDTVTGAFSGAVTVDGAAILNGGIDVAGDITLDVDGEDIKLLDAGTQWGQFSNSSTNFVMFSPVQDKDIIFKGKDGSDTITALTLDMSAAGQANFNSNIFTGNTAEFVDGTDTGDKGIQLNPIGMVVATRNGGISGIFGRQASDGAILQFRRDGVSHGGLEVASSGSTLDVFLGNASRGLKFRATSVIPRAVSDGAANDVMDLGSSASKFDDVFATNGTIQTSDKNEKQDIEELSDAEKRVAVVAKGLMRKYRWKSKVAEKGDKARTHFGIIAQDLEDAFKAEGLDASKYAMFCSDTWWEKEEKYTDDDGKEKTRIMDYEKEEDAPKDATKITRLGVRYSELLAFIISAV